MNQALDFATRIREQGISTEVYFNEGKIGKKFGYADKLGIPYATVIGEDEVKNGQYKLKNMVTGEQETLDLEGIISRLKNRE
jgi:histidyl-tRNA synthetase